MKSAPCSRVENRNKSALRTSLEEDFSAQTDRVMLGERNQGNTSSKRLSHGHKERQARLEGQNEYIELVGRPLGRRQDPCPRGDFALQRCDASSEASEIRRYSRAKGHQALSMAAYWTRTETPDKSRLEGALAGHVLALRANIIILA